MRLARRILVVGSVVCVGLFTVIVAPATAAPAHTTADEQKSVLQAAMLATVEAGATGMLARVDDGERLTRIGVGAARLDPRRPIQTNDEVRVGSITKSMVSTVTLQLVGEGRLGLGDTVEEWLPGLVPNGDGITLRMLLNHTSGIFNYTDDPSFIPTVLADPYRYWSPIELVGVATAHDPVFAPGTSWSYSNTGYILVGLILEKVTKLPIETLLEQRVIKPLHLTHTFFATSGLIRGSYAHGYIPPSLTGAGYLDASGWPPSWAWAAGAMVSNAPDLARFYTALMSGQLLTPWMLAQMTTTVEVAPGFGYGLGIYTQDTPCGPVWGHDGGIPGYVSFAYTDRAGSRSAVLLLPTQPDEAIVAAGLPTLDMALCMMLGQPAQATEAARSAAAFDLRATG